MGKRGSFVTDGEDEKQNWLQCVQRSETLWVCQAERRKIRHSRLHHLSYYYYRNHERVNNTFHSSDFSNLYTDFSDMSVRQGELVSFLQSSAGRNIYWHLRPYLLVYREEARLMKNY